jgi:hypothetical protein
MKNLKDKILKSSISCNHHRYKNETFFAYLRKYFLSRDVDLIMRTLLTSDLMSIISWDLVHHIHYHIKVIMFEKYNKL